MHGKEEAQDIVALFEDREGGRALMRATLGDPEDLTPQRMPLIIEKVKLAAGEYAAARVREDVQKEMDAVKLRHEEELALATDKSTTAQKSLENENEIKAQAIFDEQQRVLALTVETNNLKADLLAKNAYEQTRRSTVVDKSLKSAWREYRSARLLSVLVFGITTWLISSNFFDLSPATLAIATILITISGFWYVPDFLEPLILFLANSRFKKVLNNLDPAINFTDISVNYKNNSWMEK